MRKACASRNTHIGHITRACPQRRPQTGTVGGIADARVNRVDVVIDQGLDLILNLLGYPFAIRTGGGHWSGFDRDSCHAYPTCPAFRFQSNVPLPVTSDTPTAYTPGDRRRRHRRWMYSSTRIPLPATRSARIIPSSSQLSPITSRPPMSLSVGGASLPTLPHPRRLLPKLT